MAKDVIVFVRIYTLVVKRISPTNLSRDTAMLYFTELPIFKLWHSLFQKPENKRTCTTKVSTIFITGPELNTLRTLCIMQ